MDISALRERFRSRLLSRIALLEEDVRRGVDSETASRGFHSIAGIAGTVGYPEATTVAREAEDICACASDPVTLAPFFTRLRDSIRPGGPAERSAVSE